MTPLLIVATRVACLMVTPLLRIVDADSAPTPSAATAGKRVYMETFGCQMNILDSELVRDQLITLGYSFVANSEDADVVLYNTCAVRDLSEQKVLSRLGVMRERKLQQPNLIIGMLGCMSERTGDEVAKTNKHLDIVVGPSDLDVLPTLLEQARRDRLNGQSAQQIQLAGHTSRRSKTLDAAMDRLEALDQGRLVDPDAVQSQAYVRITRGCNKFCSFCVVPFTRGPEVHREPDAIVAEVQKLVAAGALEVTLLGQTINHYRHGDTSFAQLLQRVHDEVPSLPRLRFLTSYPRDFTDEALDVMARSPRMSAFLHIPAQSGSDRMLKMMNRGYTRDEYLGLIARAKQRMPDIAIVGDMIVGYPSETDEDFQASLSLLEAVRYKTVYVFKYSPRPNTVADRRDPDDVPDAVKRERNNEMLRVQQAISLQHHQALVGSTIEVLVEGAAKRDPATQAQAPRDDAGNVLYGLTKKNAIRDDGTQRLSARTRGDHIVSFDGPPSLVGQFAKVRITRATALSLSGEL
jgi:tRNA-2-methylthio-N6-dimethylallyladenosine synthase